MNNKLNECTIVTGNYKGDYYLFKNRDKSFITDHKIIHEIIDGIEVVYVTDKSQWVEGMNEYGIGLVYSFLTVKDESSSLYDVNWWVTNTSKTSPEQGKEKGNAFLDIICSKTVKEAVEKVKKYKYNGNYFVGTKEIVFEIEIFKGEVVTNKLELKPKENRIKTNHGVLIPYAGPQETGSNVKRSSSEVRLIGAERQILGFKNYTDLIKRMGQQTFDKTSILNTFRTDDTERTVNQMLLDLNLKIMHFVHFDKNTRFYGIENRLPEDYKEKLRIIVRDKKEFEDDEWLKFNTMRKQLYDFDETQYNFQ